MSTFANPVAQNESTRMFDEDDSYVGYDSRPFDDSFAAGNDVFESQLPIHGEFSPLENEGFGGQEGPIFPPPSEKDAEQGFALREWRRQNAILLEDKEKREKEALSQIIKEAEDYKVESYKKREIACENNKITNREKEKVGYVLLDLLMNLIIIPLAENRAGKFAFVRKPCTARELFLVNREKFHAEVDKNYWKSIAELIPNEVAAIEKRTGKKDLEKKPGIVVIQGPKSGKPTELSRMRQILLKLKHSAPPHLKYSPAEAATSIDATVATTSLKANAVVTAPETVAVA